MAEKQLKARIEKETRIRERVHDVREYNSAMSKATWEQSLTVKDRQASRKRADNSLKEEARLYEDLIRQGRRTKIEELYRNDELRYNRELQQLGLTFRKERL